MGYRLVDLSGQRFGRLVVESRKQPSRFTEWYCVCDCGTRKAIASQALRLGRTQSCGCLNDETRPLNRRTHGYSCGQHRLEYQIWTAAKARCFRPTDKAYRHYGGRGITMCARWADDFMAFMADMGPRPSAEHSVERIDNDGPYAPENCRWATQAEQMSNTRRNRAVTYQGRTQTIAQWAAELGLPHNTLTHRIDHHWPIEKALSSRRFTRS